jgi:hypothetical protein
MLYGLMMGIFRPGHMGELKLDKVFHKLVGMKRLPSQSTISRFLSKITVHKAQHVSRDQLQAVASDPQRIQGAESNHPGS